MNLNTLVAGMTDLVEISLKPEVVLDVSQSTQPLTALVDPGQLEAALLNVNNAIQTSGTIKVHLAQSGPDYTSIVVEDNGPGMPSDLLARAIAPFFTTRADMGGTGLGLSIV